MLTAERIYAENLKRCHSYYKLGNGPTYVVSDLKPYGQLTRTYCLIQQKVFYSATDLDQKIAILLCSCDGSSSSKE